MPQVLQGLNVVFSGVVPTHVPLSKSRAYKVAKCLGANVSESINIDSPHSSTRTVLTSGVSIPGVEPIPESDFSHFSKKCDSNSNSNSILY